MGEDGLEFKHFRPGTSSVGVCAFFPPSLVQILHICHKDGGALMHSWQGGYHKSQRGIISENPEKFRIKTPLALASQTDLGTIRLGFHLEMAGRVSRKWL